MGTATDCWPSELRLVDDGRLLKVSFEDGTAFDLTAEYLRVESPSAEVQGHSPAEKRIVKGKENVRITAVEPVGHYAARLIFDDGHDSGIYAWTYLHHLGTAHDTLWPAYVAKAK